MILKRTLDFLTLFTSFGTLVCCALPALFVAVGMGATFAGLVGSFPQMIWLSENKETVFFGSGMLLALGGFLQYRARNQPCPLDPKLAEACKSTRAWSKWIYLASLAIYVVGAFFAFVAPRLFF